MLPYATFPPPPMLPRGFVPRLGSKRKQRRAPSPRNTSREDARREWRRRVDKAAAEWGDFTRTFLRLEGRNQAYRWARVVRAIAPVDSFNWVDDPLCRLDAALAAPKPWRKERAK